mgnify:CR=1 FL=1
MRDEARDHPPRYHGLHLSLHRSPRLTAMSILVVRSPHCAGWALSANVGPQLSKLWRWAFVPEKNRARMWATGPCRRPGSLVGGFMEMTSSDFDGLRAVCGMKSIHQWRHTRFLRFFRFRHIDPPSVRRPQATEQASRRMPKRLFCVVGMADHRRQGLATAPLERATVDHAHQSSNGTRQPTFGRGGRSLC